MEIIETIPEASSASLFYIYHGVTLTGYTKPDYDKNY